MFRRSIARKVLALSIGVFALTTLQACLPKRQSSELHDVEATPAASKPATEEVLRLDSLIAKDMKTTMFRRPSDVFAVVNYFDKDCKETSEIVQLPGVNEANKLYRSGAILHHWSKNHYSVVGVSFFRHGSGIDYKKIISAFATASSGVVACFQAKDNPALAVLVAGALIEVSRKAIDSLPAESLVDGDQLIDNFAVIEKTSAKGQTVEGTSGNVTAAFSNFQLKRAP